MPKAATKWAVSNGTRGSSAGTNALLAIMGNTFQMTSDFAVLCKWLTLYIAETESRMDTVDFLCIELHFANLLTFALLYYSVLGF